MRNLCVLSLFISLCFFLPGAAAVHEADVIVYGGTSAGVTAAVQVAKMGKSVILVCPEKHLGGLTSGGLGFTDVGNKHIIGGLARDFYHRIWQHYDQPEAWNWQKKSEYGDKGQGTRATDNALRTMWIFEPHVAEATFEAMIADAKVTVVRDAWLNRDAGVKKVDGAIRSITLLNGDTYTGKAFIDATYEGDLMAVAGVSYFVGREGNEVYDEKYNGSHPEILHHKHWFAKDIDPYVIPGDPASGLLPRISAEAPTPSGKGDKRMQAYCFRMCLSNVAENRVPFPKPEGYDPAQYELVVRVFDSGWREHFEKFDPIPNHKTDTNNHGPFSTDNIGMNYDYPEASYERRAEIIAEHEQYQKGYMYFIANDPRIPKDVQKAVKQWGLAKDEFVDNGNWPYQLYIREARRMVSDVTVTEHDCLGKRKTNRPIGMGAYTMDSHNTLRYVTPEGFVQNEGDLGVGVPGPYGIDYGAIVPKKNECTNLLVPVCLSASHIAFGSIRMEPVFMILGQSAATAAVMSIDEETTVQGLDYEQLRAQLLKDGQQLE